MIILLLLNVVYLPFRSFGKRVATDVGVVVKPILVVPQLIKKPTKE